jgi:hypothetical protein
MQFMFVSPEVGRPLPRVRRVGGDDREVLAARFDDARNRAR